MTASLNLQENVPLGAMNTLGLPACARYFATIDSMDQLSLAWEFAREHGVSIIPLGGGSNVVLTKDLEALVLKIQRLERTVLERREDRVLVRAGAGELWHEFVLWTLSVGGYGLENLSLIPGTVGAAPIQNIGAYGVELKDHFVSLTAFDLVTGQMVEFDAEQCAFGYRDSRFKNDWRDRYVILSVTLSLSATLRPKLGYGDLAKVLSKRKGLQTPTALDISQAVCDVRQSKLPSPEITANAGSFFKNPVVTQQTYADLKSKYPDMVAYPAGCDWKLAAGWMIDRAGLKGYRQGSVGTYPKQALVLVNYGGASGVDVLEFAQLIQSKVSECFGVMLEVEPRFY